MRRNLKGFTLVEIMIVVAIIALLAAIAIPNLLRARLASNESLARTTLRSMSTATETWGTSNNGNYPAAFASLVSATPPYISTNYCSTTVSGYEYTCANATGSYTYTAIPDVVATTGNTTYKITTGGVLQ